MIKELIGWAGRRAGRDTLSGGLTSIRRAARELRPNRGRHSLREWLQDDRVPVDLEAPEAQRLDPALRARRGAVAGAVCCLIALLASIHHAAAGKVLYAAPVALTGLVLAVLALHRDYLAWVLADGRARRPADYLRKCPAILWR